MREKSRSMPESRPGLQDGCQELLTRPLAWTETHSGDTLNLENVSGKHN